MADLTGWRTRALEDMICERGKGLQEVIERLPEMCAKTAGSIERLLVICAKTTGNVCKACRKYKKTTGNICKDYWKYVQKRLAFVLRFA